MNHFLSLDRRRKIISIYFLITAVPLGRLALYGDLVFFEDVQLEGINIWGTLYIAFVNGGFVLLAGYARRAGRVPKPGNSFWITSAIYNVTMTGLNGAAIHDQGYWIMAIAFPLLGAFLSLSCLGSKPPQDA